MRASFFVRLPFAVTVILALVAWTTPASAAMSGNCMTECSRALQSTIKALNNRSPVAFNRMIDTDLIIKKSLSDLQLDTKYKEAFSAGLKKGLGNIGQRFLQMMPEEHWAKVIRVKQYQDHVLGLVRLDYADSGWGYLDLWLAKDSKGKVHIIDWYNYASGELYTSSVKKVVVMTSLNPTLYGKMFDYVSGRADELKVLNRYFATIQKKQYDQAYEIFKNMSVGLKKNRIFGIIAVSSANLSGNDDYYSDALANLAKYHGDDPTLAFLLIDHYFLTEDYEQAIRNLDSFQGYIDTPDAALENLKAISWMKAGKNKLAIQHASNGIRIEPELEPNYWTLFSIYTSTGKYSQAVAIGKELEKRFNYDLGPASLEKVADYRAFAKSAAYRRWHAN